MPIKRIKEKANNLEKNTAKKIIKAALPSALAGAARGTRLTEAKKHPPIYKYKVPEPVPAPKPASTGESRAVAEHGQISPNRGVYMMKTTKKATPKNEADSKLRAAKNMVNTKY